MELRKKTCGFFSLLFFNVMAVHNADDVFSQIIEKIRDNIDQLKRFQCDACSADRKVDVHTCEDKDIPSYVLVGLFNEAYDNLSDDIKQRALRRFLFCSLFKYSFVLNSLQSIV